MLTCMDLVYQRDHYLQMRHEFDTNIKLKNKIKARDNNRCTKCGIHEKYATLSVHHIEPLINHPHKALDKDNLVTLCTSCHNEFHSVFGHGITTDFGWEELLSFYDGKYSKPKKKKTLVMIDGIIEEIEEKTEKNTTFTIQEEKAEKETKKEEVKKDKNEKNAIEIPIDNNWEIEKRQWEKMTSKEHLDELEEWYKKIEWELKGYKK